MSIAASSAGSSVVAPSSVRRQPSTSRTVKTSSSTRIT
jgi:hypothetical protein